MGNARLDHGAQFFTVRGDDFRATIDEAQQDGVVDIWCHGFDGDDGYPRYYCPGGMTSLAKWLASHVEASGGRITLGDRVSKVSQDDRGWRLPLESGGELSAQQLLITAPVPQTLDLLNDGEVVLEPAQRSELEAITYVRTIGVLATLDGPPSIPAPGGIQHGPDEVFSFISDNQQKGVSSEPAVTFHANNTLSEDRWNDAEDVVLADLLEEAKPWLGDANVIAAQLKKWKYAGPRKPHEDRSFTLATEPGLLVLAGDAFGGPKVEGAFNSGLAAADVLR